MTTTKAAKLFEILWEDYCVRVPSAKQVEKALREMDEVWIQDHIAFRTLPGVHTGAHTLERVFADLGYVRQESYRFEDKKLNAFWMAPPRAAGESHDRVLPKVFISELDLTSFSPEVQRIITTATARVTRDHFGNSDNIAERLTHPEPVWGKVSLNDYLTVLQSSEYAAWTLLFGHRVNHFTVSVHLMRQFGSIAALNAFLVNSLHLTLNAPGGKDLQGSPELLLEQSSTKADKFVVDFGGETREIPYAYIEFAYRWPKPGLTADGRWDSYYQGFRTQNADKIFESTNVKG